MFTWKNLDPYKDEMLTFFFNVSALSQDTSLFNNNLTVTAKLVYKAVLSVQG